MSVLASVALSSGARTPARLRPLTGLDEAEVTEAAAALLPAERVTLLLARCVTSLGEAAPPTEHDIRALPVGERERLLLHLRRASLGSRLQCVLACPTCGERLEVDLDVEDLLAPPAADAPEHEAELDVDGRRLRVRFRLPTGADQEEAARLARRDEAAAAEWLLRRCVLGAWDAATGAPVDAPPSLAEALSPRIVALDPQSEVVLDLACAACAGTLHVLFDAGAFLLDEVTQRGRRLYREVHALASHYHWSERDILAMSTQRRALYLRLLAEDARGDAA